MSTSYDIIDNVFLEKITDSFIATLTELEIKDLLDNYRRSANVLFKQCKKLSDRDEDLRQYNEDLTDEEVEILASIMVLEWLKPKINSMENIRQGISTKDFKVYSKANHLDKILNLKESTHADIDRMMISYTFSNSSLDNLRKF